MNLAKLIAEWRKQREISIRQLAKRIGIDHNALWRFEKGEEVEGRQLAKIITWALTREKDGVL